MRESFVGGCCYLWLSCLGLAGPATLGALAGAAWPRDVLARETPEARTTTVRKGEDCQAVVRRIYGKTPGAMARFHAANPQLSGAPHLLHEGDVVNTPRLRSAETADHPNQAGRPRGEGGQAAAEPARLSYVGPEVRTRERRQGWTEALPDQPVGKRMRIQTSTAGGAEVSLQERSLLQMDPNATLVIDSLPRRKNAGEVDLIEGILHAGVTPTATPGALTVHTPSADVKLKGGARIEAEGRDRATIAVYQGTSAVRARGREVQVPAGQGTLVVAGRRPGPPTPLLPAPTWADGASHPLLIVALGKLGEAAVQGDLRLAFTPVAGAEQYLVEVARDERFNDRRGGGEVVGSPFHVSLPPGVYQARLSAIDGDRLIGPPSAARLIKVVSVYTDAAVSAAPAAMGARGQQTEQRLSLHKKDSATLLATGAGFPLLVRIDDNPEVDCTRQRAFHLGPGEHQVALNLQGARNEILVSVSAPPTVAATVTTPEPLAVEPLDLPVPLTSPGFPARALGPRTRAYALLGIGSSQGDRRADVYRLDLGGELAFFHKRFSVDLDLPLLYHDNGPLQSGPAVGDVAVGFRAVALTAASGRVELGPLLRLQFPSGTFARSAPNTHPVALDPALAGSVVLGPLGLLTTQGPTAVLAIAQPQLRWSMSYVAEVRLPWISLLAELDGALALAGGADSGAALGGGARLRLSHIHLLFGARGGLGQGGQDFFGRYYASLGAEWVR